MHKIAAESAPALTALAPASLLGPTLNSRQPAVKRRVRRTLRPLEICKRASHSS